jgi:protein CpxP
MNFFLQNRTSTIIITVLIALNLFSIYFFVVHKRISHRGRSPRSESKWQDRNKDKSDNKTHFLAKQIGFDDNQKDTFQKLHKAHFKKSGVMRKEMSTLREKMFKNIGNPEFSKDSVVTEIGLLQTQLEIDMFDHFKSVRRICNEEQKVKFDKMVKRIAKKISGHEPRSGGQKPE